MFRRPPIALLFLLLTAWPLAASETTRPEGDDADQAEPVSDIEAEGIIPRGGLTVSSQPITPLEPLAKRSPYDQGLEELALAQSLLQKGRMEAASDVALQAYDDLMSTSVSRRNKAKRRKLLSDRHQAATVYITASLAYVQSFVSEAGGGPKAMEEGRDRVADLRDVSINYPELNRKVSKALELYTVSASSATAPAS